MDIIENTKIILSNIILNEWNNLSIDELMALCQTTDCNLIPDRIIADNEEIHSIIDWCQMDRMKIIRLVIRNINILKFVDLSKYNYTTEEAKYLLKTYPEVISHLNINLKEANKKDVYEILLLGVTDVVDKIDINKYSFNFIEIFEIIKAFNYNDFIMKQINLDELKDYQMVDIILNADEKYIEILNLDKLTAKKWLEILEKKPELLKYCDKNKFKQSDIFNSVELICLFKDEYLNYLIKDRDYKEELSAYGWEMLLICKPDDFIDLCCMEKLNNSTWKTILFHQPQLVACRSLDDIA